MGPSKQLSRSLTLIPATALVVGSVVGSGIFVSTAMMARTLGNPFLLMAAWGVAGVMTLLGALTQCELAAQSPRTGGLFEFLTEAYGNTIGFFYGWATFTIAGTGGIAATAFIFASYLDECLGFSRLASHWKQIPLKDVEIKIAATALVLVLTWLNVRGVRLSAKVQTLSTTAKVLAILGVVGAVFWLGGHGSGHSAGHGIGIFSGFTSNFRGSFGVFALALSAAFWAYDGWGLVAYVAGEVKSPEKTLPRAIILGTLIFTALYLLVNFAYLHVLPVEELGKVPQDRVASAVMKQVMGPLGAKVIAFLIVLSTFDATNSGVLTNARVYFAMAHRRMFFSRAGTIDPRYQTPAFALRLQGFWAIVLIVTGSFELIASMYVFVNWVFYVLMGGAVFILRRRNPARARPFSVPGYPWVPLTFVVFAFFYVGMTGFADLAAYRSGAQPFMQSALGLLLVFSGYPVFVYFSRRGVGANTDDSPSVPIAVS